MQPSDYRLTSLADLAGAGFDTIIDARAPVEFAADHLPGAVNLPVLSDDERATVGTIYKQVSPFDARKAGGALTAANIARHVAGPLAGFGGGWRPLVYCWRGGQRSGAFATVLAQIGWRTARLEGGWKSWRTLVTQQVEVTGPPCPLVVLDGNTGAAKTEILGLLAARGTQIIDLERLANHRGSLFGAMPDGQPPQKQFESRLALVLAGLDATRPAVIEAESSRIGDLVVPRAVWRAMCAAPRLRLSVPVQARAAYTAASYADAIAQPGRVAETLARLSPLHPADRIAAWQGLAQAGDWAALALGLMRDHYDPRYEKHRARHAAAERAVIPVQDLSPKGLEIAAAAVEATVAQIGFAKAGTES